MQRAGWIKDGSRTYGGFRSGPVIINIMINEDRACDRQAAAIVMN